MVGIPEELAHRTARLINEIEDVRAQYNQSLKDAYSDLREELRAMKMPGAEISKEVAAFKAALAETRLTADDRQKAEEKGDLVAAYVSILNSPRARARERQIEPRQCPPADARPAAAPATPGSRPTPPRRGLIQSCAQAEAFEDSPLASVGREAAASPATNSLVRIREGAL